MVDPPPRSCQNHGQYQTFTGPAQAKNGHFGELGLECIDEAPGVARRPIRIAMLNRQTIRKEVKVEGVALHSGDPVRLRLLPA